MGYVQSAHASVGTRLFAEVRGQRLAVTVASLPFVPSSYKRG
jgi:aminomethyltransferase